MFSLFLVVLVPSEESSHGLWSLYFPRGVLWLVYVRTLSLPLLVRKASRSWRLLMACHPSTVLSLVSFPMASPHSSLYAGWGFALDVLQRFLVYVSPGVFLSPNIRNFFLSCHGNPVWRFKTCASFSSRLLGVSQGRVPWVIHASLRVCITFSGVHT